MEYAVGYAFFFERVVVFGDVHALLTWTSSKGRRRFSGKYLGTVKGVIPIDPFRILYFVHHSTDAYKQRLRLRRFLQRHHITKAHLRKNAKLTPFIK